jgi:hypothetical protein
MVLPLFKEYSSFHYYSTSSILSNGFGRYIPRRIVRSSSAEYLVILMASETLAPQEENDAKDR